MSAEGGEFVVLFQPPEDLQPGKQVVDVLQGGVVAGGGTPEQEEAAAEFADHLGMAFQIRDDILDVTATEEELGKPIGSDRANEKTTYVTLCGTERCEQLVLEHTRQAKAALARTTWAEEPGFLLWLADRLALRKK